MAISEKPWDGSASRFTDEEWKRSTILDTGEGEGKSRYKLPIKEPNGDLSRAGVHAAAGRLNQVQASDAAKAKAKSRLRSAYSALSEDPPEGLTAAAEATPEAVPEPSPTHAGLAVYAEDTGRILMIQRSMDETDPPEVQGTWEFPGGRIEGNESAVEGAMREFVEETGCPVPDGQIVRDWLSEDGVYQGFVMAVPVEADTFEEINPDAEAAHEVNPDDPERRNPDVSAWFTVEHIKSMGKALRPEVAKTDWTLFEKGKHMTTNPEKDDRASVAASLHTEGLTWGQVAQTFATDLQEPPVEPDKTEQPTEPINDKPGEEAPTPDQAVPFHTVIAVEGRKTGDNRRFLDNSLSSRPLPLPFAWQKVAAPEHQGGVVVGQIEKIKHRVPIVTQDGEQAMAQVGSGHFIDNAESDEFIGMLAEFGRFGTSVDADSAVGEVNEEDECVDFTLARTSGVTAVPIPALYESWVSIGEPPPEWGMDDPEEEAEPEALVASAGPITFKDATALLELVEAFKDLAPGKTEDGPGWLTHPVDTDRLRDYWVRGPGAAKIGWGTPGDFNRCRVETGKYIEPQHLAGYCANRHYDALGFWPGRPLSSETTPFASETLHLTDTEAAPTLTLVASGGGIKAPAAWFDNPGFAMGDPRLVQQPDGTWACPFTITEEGQVFGHIAHWGQCHISPQFKYCQEPPRSETEYANFCTGAVLLDTGEQIATGVISIGGGHAGPMLNARQALAHYDSTSTAGCDVACYDDDFGIAVAGWVRPGTSDEMVCALRASSISGDWRPIGVHPTEMVAALAVNVPGFGVTRPRLAASSEGLVSLVAAGMVAPHEEGKAEVENLDTAAFAQEVAIQLAAIQQRREQVAAFAARTWKVG